MDISKIDLGTIRPETLADQVSLPELWELVRLHDKWTPDAVQSIDYVLCCWVPTTIMRGEIDQEGAVDLQTFIARSRNTIARKLHASGEVLNSAIEARWRGFEDILESHRLTLVRRKQPGDTFLTWDLVGMLGRSENKTMLSSEFERQSQVSAGRTRARMCVMEQMGVIVRYTKDGQQWVALPENSPEP